MKVIAIAVAGAVIGFALPECGSGPKLTEAYTTSPPTTSSIQPPSPTGRAAAIVRPWRDNLRSGALADPRTHFPNPPRAALTSRLQLAATRYRFTVVKVEM